jgi:hypothetical protein
LAPKARRRWFGGLAFQLNNERIDLFSQNRSLVARINSDEEVSGALIFEQKKSVLR